MYIQQLLVEVPKARDAERSKYHLTLGKLIEKLKEVGDDFDVVFSDGSIPNSFDSYRGYYSDLAIDSSDNPMKVSTFKLHALSSLNREFTGYKGGEFLMNEETPLWRAEYGCNTSDAIIDAYIIDNKFTLIIKKIGE